MKKLIALVAVFIGGIAIAWMLESTVYGDSILKLENPEITQLRTEIEVLKERIAALEKESLSAQIAIPVNTVGNRREVPKDWEVRRFRGHEFFVVPLKHTERKTN